MFKPLDFLVNMAEPLLILGIASSHIPGTIFELLISLQLATLLSPSGFKHAWFARFWRTFGPGTKTNARPRVQPLLEQVGGVVLDIGPGSGEWLSTFDKAKVTKIYGVEPNPDFHHLLRQRIKEAGLEGIYHIVPVGVEDLDGKGLYGGEVKLGGWVQRGEVDSVITIQCLCSVQTPKEMIGGLYSYLKEGGTWTVYEHVVMNRGGIFRWYQAAINIVWPHFLGGCSLTRDTERWLKQAGSWSKVDLKQPAEEPSYLLIPHIMGTLTK